VVSAGRSAGRSVGRRRVVGSDGSS
jgi:hypothetical protein